MIFEEDEFTFSAFDISEDSKEFTLKIKFDRPSNEASFIGALEFLVIQVRSDATSVFMAPENGSIN